MTMPSRTLESGDVRKSRMHPRDEFSKETKEIVANASARAAQP